MAAADAAAANGGGSDTLPRFSKRGVDVGRDVLEEGERCMAHQLFRVARDDGRIVGDGDTTGVATLDIKVRCVDELPFDELIGLLVDVDSTGLQIWDACGLMLREIVKPSRGYGTVVELGCGVGLISVAYVVFHPGCRYIATDGNPECVDTAASNIKLNADLIPAGTTVDTAELWFGDAAHTEAVKAMLPEAGADAVLATDTVYCDTPRTVIASMFDSARAVCPGGPFLLSFIQRRRGEFATDKAAVLEEAAKRGYACTVLGTCGVEGTNEINTMFEFIPQQ